MPDQFCQWTHTGTMRYSEGWKSACGEVYLFSAGSPLEDGWKYCPFCGLQVEEDGADE